MDSNEGRRSKVPAGTFRSSNKPPPAPGAEKPGATPPPPPPAATSARPPAKPPGVLPAHPPGAPSGKPPAPPPATLPKRRERVGTLSGHPPGIELPADVDGRAKFTNTLVGVTPSVAPPPASGPVLAPPPWRGASAYQGGQDPQPRVSSISSPGVVPGVLADGTVAHPDDRRVPHTRITAAAAPPAPSPEVEEVAPATAAIGDAIQQLLDAQTAVSMEGVQESAQDITASSPASALGDDDFLRDSALEPVRESQIEVLRDSAIEEVEEPAQPVRSLPPAAPVARRHLAGEPDEPAERSRVEPSAVPEPRATAPSARWASTPTPVVAPVEPKPVLSDRELAAYSFVEREPEREESVAPAERPQASAPEPDGANMRLGLMVAAAMLIVGVGGWAATRGGFVKPPRTPAAAPAIAAPPPSSALAPKAPGTAPEPSPELGDVAPTQPAAPGSSTTPSTTPAVTAQTPAADKPESAVSRPVAARPPRAPKWSGAQPSAPEPSEPASQPVLSVTPSATAPAQPAQQAAPLGPQGPLPETPTRENVQSALDAKRTEVLACAGGQRGVAEVDLTVASSGAVTHAVVAGDFAGSAAGSCIARVVRTARFAPFSKPRFRVIYPFSL